MNRYLWHRSWHEVSYRDVATRSLLESFCRELEQRSCKKDVLQKPCLGMFHACTVQRSCQETSCRDLPQRLCKENRGLAKRSFCKTMQSGHHRRPGRGPWPFLGFRFGFWSGLWLRRWRSSQFLFPHDVQMLQVRYILLVCVPRLPCASIQKHVTMFYTC